MYLMDDILTELIQISICLTDSVPIDSSKITIDFNIPQDIRKKNILKEKLFTPSFLNALEKSRTLLGKYWTRLNNIDILYNSMLLDPRFKQQRLKDNVDAKEFQKILEDKRKILKESISAKPTSDSFITNIISNVNNMGGQPSNILHLQSKSKIS